MQHAISAQLKGGVCALLAILSALIAVIPVMLIALFKWLLSSKRAKRYCTHLSITIFEHLVQAYRASYLFIHRPQWDVQGFDGLCRDKSYLVVCNHQSWADIPIMAFPLLGKTPFFKFFIKRELIWLPLIGVACWALDFPFMQRYSREELENNPQWRGRDLETTRELCEKLHGEQVTIVNYIEGTRFRPDKQAKQRSPYRHLLKPKSGGLAYVINMLSDQLAAIVDITIIYPDGRMSFWDFLCGRLDKVIVRAERRAIPEHLRKGDYQGSETFRNDFQLWVADLWQEKDALIESSLSCKEPSCKNSSGKAPSSAGP